MNIGITERNDDSENNIISNKIAFSVEEISEQTTLSKAFLRNEIRAGKLRAVRPGNSRRVLIMKNDLMDYLTGENTDEK